MQETNIPQGATRIITANAAPVGFVFAGWIVDIQFLADASLAETTTTMPARDVTVSALYVAETPTVPSALADLTEDATHRTVTDAEKGIWNGKQPSGSYLVAADKTALIIRAKRLSRINM